MKLCSGYNCYFHNIFLIFQYFNLPLLFLLLPILFSTISSKPGIEDECIVAAVNLGKHNQEMTYRKRRSAICQLRK